MTGRLFPILPINVPGKAPQDLGMPGSIPWSMVENHEPRAMQNHSQTLTRLAERGGLDPIELYWLWNDLRYGTGGEDWPALIKTSRDFMVKRIASHDGA